MFTINETDESIHFKFSSEMRLVDRTVKECCEFMKQYNGFCVTGFKLILRELLINAVEHGNQNLVEQSVQCSIRHLDEKRYSIMVEDQGSGFDYRTLEMSLPEDPRQSRRRGYALINAFADQIEWNDKGTCVTAYFSFGSETTFETISEGDWQVIRPSGDITAGVAEKFRNFLLDLVTRGNRQIRFDLADVEDVDLVGLSALIAFTTMLNKQKDKAELEIVNANKDLVNMFHMTRLDNFYRVTGQEEGHGT